MICDDKGFKLSTNNKDRFMQARMLIAVIYHNYIILLCGGMGEYEASGPFALVPASTQRSTV